jgi:hypothetical protein
VDHPSHGILFRDLKRNVHATCMNLWRIMLTYICIHTYIYDEKEGENMIVSVDLSERTKGSQEKKK